MPIKTTSFRTTKEGMTVTVLGVPTVFTEEGEEVGFDLRVMRDLEVLIARAVQNARAGTTSVEVPYAQVTGEPDPVSLELRRALRLRRLTGARLAEQLGVTPPVVSRWLSPDYHAHGLDALRRIADALDMDVEVRLVPREKRSA